MRRPHFRRHPRPTEMVRSRYDAQVPDVRAAEAGGDLAAMAAPRPGRSCIGCGYTPADPSECVVGACVPGYHELALIPAPGMARDCLGTYAEPVEWVEPPAIVTRSRQVRGYFWLPCPVCGEHFSGADVHSWHFDGRPTGVPDPAYPPGSGRGKMICPRCIRAGRGVSTLDAEACTAYFAQHAGRRAELEWADGDRLAITVTLEAEPVEPMPRYVFERVMADLASLDRELDAFADGRAYETGHRTRTEAAAMRHARTALDDRTRGARDAAWILAGHVGAEVA